MNSNNHTPFRRRAAARRGPLAPVTLAFLLCALILAWGVPGRAQAPTPPPFPTPPGATPPGANPPGGGKLEINNSIVAGEIIPANEDPTDPTATPEERLRRQKVVIMKRIQRRQEMELAKERAENDAKNRTQEAADAQKAAAEQAAQTAKVAAEDAVSHGKTPPPVAAPLSQETITRKTPTYVTVFLAPGAINTRPGEKFSTLCSVLNTDHLPVSAVELNISYPAWAVKLVGIHHDKLLPNLSSEPECRVDEKAGAIVYKAKLSKINRTMDIPLLTFVWQALVPLDEGEIRLSIGQRDTLVYGGKKILNSGKWGQLDTLMGTTIHFGAAASNKPSPDRYLDFGNQQLMQTGFKDQRQLRPPSLWMKQTEGQILKPGEWLVVDLGVSNPGRCVFDEVRLAASFDPEAVEVVDSDRGNWIGEGVNLLDGPFHKEWPWDNLFKNYADNAQGIFYYRMAMSDLREQPSGTLARVFVRAKRPVQTPVFNWIMAHSANPEEPGSGVYLFNHSVYGRLLKTAAGQADSLQAATRTRMPAYDLAPGMEKADPAAYRQ